MKSEEAALIIILYRSLFLQRLLWRQLRLSDEVNYWVVLIYLISPVIDLGQSLNKQIDVRLSGKFEECGGAGVVDAVDKLGRIHIE